MKRCLIILLMFFLTGCSVQPAWIAPDYSPLPTPIPTQEQKTPEPIRFDAMDYVNSLLGGGHDIEGTTLTLGRDIVLTAPLYITGYKGLTLDLNGHTVQYEAEGLKTENGWKDAAFIFDESRVTLRSSVPGGTIECRTPGAITGIIAMDHSALTVNGANITLAAGVEETSYGIYATGGAYVEIESGSISADCAVYADDPTQEGTTLVIDGGNIGGGECLVGAYIKGTVTSVINGGSFGGSSGGLYAEGNPYVTVYNGSFNKISDAAQSGWMPELGKGAVWENGDSGMTARREA